MDQIPRHVLANIHTFTQQKDLINSCVHINKAFSEIAITELEIRETERNELISEIIIPTGDCRISGSLKLNITPDELITQDYLGDDLLSIANFKFFRTIDVDVLLVFGFYKPVTYFIRDVPLSVLKLIKYARDRFKVTKLDDGFREEAIPCISGDIHKKVYLRHEYISLPNMDKYYTETCKHERSHMNLRLKKCAIKLGLVNDDKITIRIIAHSITVSYHRYDIKFYLFIYQEESWIMIINSEGTEELTYILKGSSLRKNGILFMEFLITAEPLTDQIYLTRRLDRSTEPPNPVFEEIEIDKYLEEYYPADAELFFEKLAKSALHIYFGEVSILFNDS
jgi:hypothetical protein